MTMTMAFEREYGYYKVLLIVEQADSDAASAALNLPRVDLAWRKVVEMESGRQSLRNA